MYKIDDVVMYKNSGVCEITDITPKKFIDKEIDYYVLKLIYNDKSVIYCPVGNEDKLRKIITKEKIDEILSNLKDYKIKWIENKNLRIDEYNKIIKEGNQEKLIGLIRAIHLIKDERKKNGKKLNLVDERAMNEAEKLINQEFGYALNIAPDEVKDYILSYTK